MFTKAGSQRSTLALDRRLRWLDRRILPPGGRQITGKFDWRSSYFLFTGRPPSQDIIITPLRDYALGMAAGFLLVKGHRRWNFSPLFVWTPPLKCVSVIRNGHRIWVSLRFRIDNPLECLHHRTDTAVGMCLRFIWTPPLE